MLPDRAEFVLTIACADVMGIVHAVAGFLSEHDCNILDSAQFGDPASQRFFMRGGVAFVRSGPCAGGRRRTSPAFRPIAERFAMESELRDLDRAAALAADGLRATGHCLNDLLFR